jgi:malonate-semialdehyde dehydrogenase (acetylating)/methylmalonate-semialdehyde dehydrogenase
MKEFTHFIAGKAVKGSSGRFGDIFNPATGEVQAKVPLASRAEMRAAVEAAAKAFPEWSAVNPQRRARVMFNFKSLVEKNMDELAHMLSSEHGKVIADSKGDIQRGIEVIEFACGIPHLSKGEYTEGAGPGIDIYSMRQPLGVVAGITPFNFPAMIPMWMFGGRDRLRQHFHLQTVGEGSERSVAPRRVVHGSGRAGRCPQCRQRRQGSGRRNPRGP